MDSEFLVLAHGASTELIRDLEHEHLPMHLLLTYLPGTLLTEDPNKKSGQGYCWFQWRYSEDRKYQCHIKDLRILTLQIIKFLFKST